GPRTAKPKRPFSRQARQECYLDNEPKNLGLRENDIVLRTRACRLEAGRTCAAIPRGHGLARTLPDCDEALRVAMPAGRADATLGAPEQRLFLALADEADSEQIADRTANYLRPARREGGRAGGDRRGRYTVAACGPARRERALDETGSQWRAPLTIDPNLLLPPYEDYRRRP